MDIHIIAAVAGDMALDGFRASKLDRRWFRAATALSSMQGEHLWPWYLLRNGWAYGDFPLKDSPPFNAVIVGRKTFNGDLRCKALPGRSTIILSRTVPPGIVGDGLDPRPGCRTWYCGTLESAIKWANELGCPHAWIAGGAEVYRQALRRTDADLYLTTIDDDAPRATVYMPDLSGWRTEESTGWLQDDSRRIRIDRMVRG